MTVKNAKTDSSNDETETGIDGRCVFFNAPTINHVSDPKQLAAVMKRNTDQRSAHVDQTFIREGLPALNWTVAEPPTIKNM